MKNKNKMKVFLIKNIVSLGIFITSCMNYGNLYFTKDKLCNNVDYELSPEGQKLKLDMVNFIKSKSREFEELYFKNLLGCAEKIFDDLVFFVAKKGSIDIKNNGFKNVMKDDSLENLFTPRTEALKLISEVIKNKELFFGAILKYSLECNKIKKSKSQFCKKQYIRSEEERGIFDLCDILGINRKKTASSFDSERRKILHSASTSYLSPFSNKVTSQLKSLSNKKSFHSIHKKKSSERKMISFSGYSVDLIKDKERRKVYESKLNRVKSTYTFDLKKTEKKEVKFVFHPILEKIKTKYCYKAPSSDLNCYLNVSSLDKRELKSKLTMSGIKQKREKK